MRCAMLVGVLIVGCGDDGAGPPGDVGQPIDATPAPCSGCGAGEGCLTVTVSRTADVSAQPWTVWPAEADGRGTLIVSVRDGATVLERVPVADASFVDAATSYAVVIDCVPARTLTLGAFLDDNDNAGTTETSSSDYRDSCLLMRQPTTVVAAGVPNEVALQLNNSCD